jgi:ribosome-associated protein
MSTNKAGDEGGPSPTKDAKEKALLCAHWALEKKAHGIVILNVGVLTPIAEYFLICSGRSVRQTQAIVEHIRTRLKQELKELPLGTEGEREGCWVLLDCDDVIVHVFDEPTRDLYRLEKLWSDAPRVTDPDILEEERKAAASWPEEEGDWED